MSRFDIEPLSESRRARIIIGMATVAVCVDIIKRMCH